MILIWCPLARIKSGHRQRGSYLSRACFSPYALSLALISSVCVSAPAQSRVIDLTLRNRIEKNPTAREIDVYGLRLESGAAAIIEVQERSGHVATELIDTVGHAAASLERKNAGPSLQRLTFTAVQSGLYRLVVTADSNYTGGAYSVTLAAVLAPIENAKRLAKEELQSAALYALWWDVSQGDTGVVERFLQRQKGIGPLVEPIAGDTSNLRVTYLFAGDPNTDAVRMCGGPQCAVSWLPLMRFMGSSMFYASEIVPRDARYRYHFLVTDVRRLGPGGIVRLSEDRDVIDSLNPHTANGLSALVLPDAPPEPYIGVRTGAARGKLVVVGVHSTRLDADRTIAVYTPPGYVRTTKYNLLIVFDGDEYGADSTNAAVPMPTILDNMISDGKIGPTIALLIPNVDRERDLGGYSPFAAFIAQELIPWARAHYSIWPGPGRIVLAGSSRGGHAATYIAFHHPDVVGNVLSQSGAYWIRSTLDQGSDWPFPYAFDHPALIDEIRDAPRRPIRFYLEVGRFDSAVSMVPLNRELRDLLISKGYDVTYREFDGGHNYFAWRGSISQGLIALLGR